MNTLEPDIVIIWGEDGMDNGEPGEDSSEESWTREELNRAVLAIGMGFGECESESAARLMFFLALAYDAIKTQGGANLVRRVTFTFPEDK